MKDRQTLHRRGIKLEPRKANENKTTRTRSHVVGNRAVHAVIAGTTERPETTTATGQIRDNSAQATANGLHLSKLIGAQVKSNNGENLGKLEDVVIDPQTGRATFAIVGKGGILRLGEKRMPVPWQAITIDSQKRLTLNVDKEKLQSAPTTAQTDDTDLDNPDFVVLVYKFYEITPP